MGEERQEPNTGVEKERAEKRAEILMVVRVRFSGGIKDIEQAKHLARVVVESGSFEAAGLRGPGSHEYGEEESEDLITLEGITGDGVTFASLG